MKFKFEDGFMRCNHCGHCFPHEVRDGENAITCPACGESARYMVEWYINELEDEE